MKKHITILAVLATAITANAGELSLSTRGRTSGGDEVLIGGLIVHNIQTKVVIRAIGPSLNQYGLGGPNAIIQDPRLFVYDQQGHLIGAQNSYLELDNQDMKTLQNNNLVPDDQRECALVLDLDPGSYTAIVRGARDNFSGLALVEFFPVK
jgi:hypothetical protein